MAKQVIVLDGVVDECLPNTTFRVTIKDENYPEMTILSHVSGRMRMNNIRIIPGDLVQVEMTPHDLTKGRIVFRYKDANHKKATEEGRAAAEETDSEEETNETES